MDICTAATCSPRSPRRSDRRFGPRTRSGATAGTKFVAIFPETAEPAAVGLAERVPSAISEGVTDTLDGRVEASAGVAEWSPGVSAEELLHGADQALSAAKERGGATVVSAGRIGPYVTEPR